MCSSPATPAIRAEALSKCYQLYARPADRLRQLLWGRRHRYYREFWALREASFEVARGEVLGLVGRNGAGKSTLLQLVCGTLAPSSGTIAVNGRVTALLELGAGFNPEFSGRENVYLAASIMGLSTAEVEARFEQIVDFSGIRDFIEQPVKTYSSGMYVRLAFSVATSVDPDILVVDEALSVGDGDFARKSFERIMALKDAGKTILFCSHALYQIEALCNSVIWLDQGEMRAMGSPSEVVAAYNGFLDSLRQDRVNERPMQGVIPPSPAVSTAPARLVKAVLDASNGSTGKDIRARSAVDDVTIRIEFESNPALPTPSVGVVFVDGSGRNICSAGSHIDKVHIVRDAAGKGQVQLTFPRIPLLKGDYFLDVFLLCERGIHVYEHAKAVSKLTMLREDLEQGVVSLPRRWN